MRIYLYIILLATFVMFSCAKDETLENDTNSFSILAYDSEISETLGLNIEDIRIDPIYQQILYSTVMLISINL